MFQAFKTDAPSFSMSMNTNDVNRVPCYLEDYLLRSDYIAHYHRDFVVRKRRLGLCARGGGGREISSRTREIVVDWLIQVQVPIVPVFFCKWKTNFDSISYTCPV